MVSQGDLEGEESESNQQEKSLISKKGALYLYPLPQKVILGRQEKFLLIFVMKQPNHALHRATFPVPQGRQKGLGDVQTSVCPLAYWKHQH